MILPFIRIKLDNDGLCNGKTSHEIWAEMVSRLITDLKENKFDAKETVTKEISNDESIPEEYTPYFNGERTYYAFLQFTYDDTPNGYYLDWRRYCTDEQRSWIENWIVKDAIGRIDEIESAKKLRALS